MGDGKKRGHIDFYALVFFYGDEKSADRRIGPPGLPWGAKYE